MRLRIRILALAAGESLLAFAERRDYMAGAVCSSSS